MQEEQEPSVTDILSSIRQILSDKLEGKEEDEGDLFEALAFEVPALSVEDDSVRVEESVSETTEEEVVFLTPQMQIAEPAESVEVSASVISAAQETPVIDVPMTPERVEENIQPLIQEWLDRHLPQMVERIVSEEVRRIFNKR